MSITQARFTTQLRTWLFVAGLSGLLLVVGALIGGKALYFFVGLTVAMNVIGYWFSDRIAIKMSRARPAEPGEYPDLERMVTELAGLAQVPVPKLYIIPSEQPNAFATGRNPQHAAVAATEGLLRHLPYDQVRGVMAHEFAHIKNRDILVSSIAAVIAGAIAAIANILQFSLLFGGSDEEDSPLGIVGALATIIIAPIAATMLQLAVSRQREYLADASAARMLGTGQPLANALRNLERGIQAVPMNVNPASATLYIANPLSAKGMGALFSTHPPMAERIARLEAYDASLGIVAAA
jgi:heat shock protein HtpX